MFGKCLSLALASALLPTAAPVPARAGQQASAGAVKLEELREKAGNLAKRPRCKARVKSNDGRELKGHITEAPDEYFVIVSPETRTAAAVRYPQVVELRQSRRSQMIAAAGAWGVFFGLVVIPLMASGTK